MSSKKRMSVMSDINTNFSLKKVQGPEEPELDHPFPEEKFKGTSVDPFDPYS
jgi:hypothetical protein